MGLVPTSSFGGSGGGSELSYVEFTATVGCTGTSAATATTVVTAGAVSFDGATKVMIEFYCPSYSASSAGVNGKIGLFEDGTNIGVAFDESVGISPAANLEAIYVARRMTPSAGTHTYSWRGWTPAGGTFSCISGAGGASTDFPGFIRIFSFA